MQMPSKHETVTICCHYVPGGDLHMGIDTLADALLLMTASPVLNDALRIAHARAHAAHRKHVRRRELDAQMATLRVQLVALEDQAREDIV